MRAPRRWPAAADLRPIGASRDSKAAIRLAEIFQKGLGGILLPRRFSQRVRLKTNYGRAFRIRAGRIANRALHAIAIFAASETAAAQRSKNSTMKHLQVV